MKNICATRSKWRQSILEPAFSADSFVRRCRGFCKVSKRGALRNALSDKSIEPRGTRRVERLLESTRRLSFIRDAQLPLMRRVWRPSCRHGANVDYTFCFASRGSREPLPLTRQTEGKKSATQFAYSLRRRPISGGAAKKAYHVPRETDKGFRLTCAELERDGDR